MPLPLDLTGKQFNHLRVLYKDKEKSQQTKKSYWVCECDCGTIKSIYAHNLKSGHTQSCGCYQKQRTSENNTNNLINQHFGKLTVINRAGSDKYGTALWKCRCECGNEIICWGSNLTQGRNQSCGCLKGSYGENQITKILTENNINFIREYIFDDFKPYRYDFYLPDFNRLIEFDGEQHYQECSGSWNQQSTLKDRKERDLLKNSYAKNNKIDLIRIPYWEKENITLEMLLGNNYLVEGN